MKSQSVSGPIGCPAPSRMPWSMSSRVAKPSSYIRTAAIRYGTSSMFTMNPLRSLVRIGVFAMRRAKASARSTTSGAVSSPTTTSTSFMTGTGEKKCSPSTRVGSRVHDAICAIGIDDVFRMREVAELGRVADALEQRLAFRGTQLPGRDRAAHRGRDRGARTIERCALGLVDDHLQPGSRNRLRDAGPHEPGACDADDVHVHLTDATRYATFQLSDVRAFLRPHDSRRMAGRVQRGARARRRVPHAERRAGQAAVHRGRRGRFADRSAGAVSVHAWGVPVDVPRAAVDDAAVRRVRDGGGDQRALPLPARPWPDGAEHGIRHAVADGPRLRPRALAG